VAAALLANPPRYYSPAFFRATAPYLYGTAVAQNERVLKA